VKSKKTDQLAIVNTACDEAQNVVFGAFTRPTNITCGAPKMNLV
jgi:hypothetical protein